MKFFITSLVCLFLCSCIASTWDGTLTKNGKAYKISIEEGGQVYVGHFKIYINGEYVGNADVLDRSLKKHTYAPINTKFGVFKMERNLRMNIGGDKDGFDCYLDGDYVGTVNAKL